MFNEEENTSQTPPLIEAEFSQNLTQKLDLEPNILSLNRKKPVASLKLLSSDKSEVIKEYSLYGGQNFIGRNKSCEICLPSSNVSKRHACIEILEDDHLLFDCDSLNKTKRNNKLLLPNVRYELVDGVSLTFADVSCVYSLKTASRLSTDSHCSVQQSNAHVTIAVSTPLQSSSTASVLFANYLPKLSSTDNNADHDNDSLSQDLLDQQEAEIDDEVELDSLLIAASSRRQPLVEDTSSFLHVSAATSSGWSLAKDLPAGTSSVVKETQSFHDATGEGSTMESSLHLHLSSTDDNEDTSDDDENHSKVEKLSAVNEHEPDDLSLDSGDVMSSICKDRDLLDILHGTEESPESDRFLFSDTSPYIDGIAIDIKSIKKNLALASLDEEDSQIADIVSHEKLGSLPEESINTAKRVSFKETPAKQVNKSQDADKRVRKSTSTSSSADLRDLGDKDKLSDPKTSIAKVRSVRESRKKPQELARPASPEDTDSATDKICRKKPLPSSAEETDKTTAKVSRKKPKDLTPPPTAEETDKVSRKKPLPPPSIGVTDKVSRKSRKQLMSLEETDKEPSGRAKGTLRQVESESVSIDDRQKQTNQKRGKRNAKSIQSEIEHPMNRNSKSREDDFVVKKYLTTDAKQKNAKTKKSARVSKFDLDEKVEEPHVYPLLLVREENQDLSDYLNKDSDKNKRKRKNVQQNDVIVSATRLKQNSVKPKLGEDSKELETPKLDLVFEEPCVAEVSDEVTEKPKRKGRRICADNNVSLQTQTLEFSKEIKTKSVKVPKNSAEQKSPQRKEKRSSIKGSPVKDKIFVDLHENTSQITQQKRKRNSLDESIVSGSPRKKPKTGPSEWRIAFTGIAEKELIPLTKIVTDFGAKVEESPDMSTHLIAENVKRTAKFLCAVARGIPILSPDWLKQSKKQSYFVDSTSFVLHDKEAEKKFGFHLKETLRKASHFPLLTDYTVHATNSVKPPLDQMKDIITCAGGKFSTTSPSKRFEGDKFFVISCEEDKSMWMKFEKSNLNIVSPEIVLSGLLKYELDISKYQLKT